MSVKSADMIMLYLVILCISPLTQSLEDNLNESKDNIRSPYEDEEADEASSTFSQIETFGATKEAIHIHSHLVSLSGWDNPFQFDENRYERCESHPFVVTKKFCLGLEENKHLKVNSRPNYDLIEEAKCLLRVNCRILVSIEDRTIFGHPDKIQLSVCMKTSHVLLDQPLRVSVTLFSGKKTDSKSISFDCTFADYENIDPSYRNWFKMERKLRSITTGNGLTTKSLIASQTGDETGCSWVVNKTIREKEGVGGVIFQAGSIPYFITVTFGNLIDSYCKF